LIKELDKLKIGFIELREPQFNEKDLFTNEKYPFGKD
jgi:hypothetical protein